MDIVYVIVPLTIVLAIAGLGGFIWALKREQFEDLETPAVRVLFDEHEPQRFETKKREAKGIQETE